MRLSVLLSIVLFVASTFANSESYATPVLDCTMKANACGMTGATVTLPWETIPDAAQYPYRQQYTGEFDVAYGYAQATGDYAAGNLIIRDEDRQLGAYWGFVPTGESTYFAMIAGSESSGYKMGVKGCADSPRVWSASCRLTTAEALQAEIYSAAGIGR